MVQISLQNSGGKMVFLGGSMEPPLGTLLLPLQRE